MSSLLHNTCIVGALKRVRVDDYVACHITCIVGALKRVRVDDYVACYITHALLVP